MKKIKDFFNKFKYLTFKKGDLILRSDDDNIFYIYFILDGYVRLFIDTENGTEFTITIFKPNSFFPMISAINNLPNRYNFEAINDVKVYKAPKKEVIKFLKNNPDALYDLTQRFAKGLDGLTKLIEAATTESATNRILMNLFIHSQRFGFRKNGSVVIDLNLSLKDIANNVGLTRETVSRELKKMIRRKLVSRYNNHFILNNLKKIEDQLFID